jgi:hypothetical protein
MDLLEVDFPPGRRYDLVQGTVLEEDERAAVTPLHTQSHPDLVVVVDALQDGQPQAVEGGTHPGARRQHTCRARDPAGRRRQSRLAVLERLVHHFRGQS